VILRKKLEQLTLEVAFLVSRGLKISQRSRSHTTKKRIVQRNLHFSPVCQGFFLIKNDEAAVFMCEEKTDALLHMGFTHTFFTLFLVCEREKKMCDTH
jgi:hypothetical protein